MPAEPNVLNDNGLISGSFDININGFPYTMDTYTRNFPVSEAVAMNADGTFKGGASVKGQQKITVKINAITGVPKPSQLVPFAWGEPGETPLNWKVTTCSLTASNSGASLRSYSAEITQYKAAITGQT